MPVNWNHLTFIEKLARRSSLYTANRPYATEQDYYISPALNEDYMINLIASLNQRENFLVQVNKPYATYPKQVKFL